MALPGPTTSSGWMSTSSTRPLGLQDTNAGTGVAVRVGVLVAAGSGNAVDEGVCVGEGVEQCAFTYVCIAHDAYLEQSFSAVDFADLAFIDIDKLAFQFGDSFADKASVDF